MTAWPTALIRPPRLARGDRVAIVSPCWGGPATFPQRYEAGIAELKRLFTFDVVEMQHTRADADWLDRHPKARADDLMAAFADPNITAIISSIGGDDAERLLPFLDLDLIEANPKVFLGYSNTTVLSFAFLKTGLVSFYGPAIMSGFAENGGALPYMVRSLERVLFAADPPGEVAPNRDGWTVEHLPWADPANQTRRRTLQPSTAPRLLQGVGVVRGRLIGGCADTLECLKATPWWPPLEYWQGALLFYETSEEAPSPRTVAGWLRHMGNLGVLDVLGGLLFARPGGRIDPATHIAYDAEIVRALAEAGRADMPVLANLDFGHTDPMCTIPYGIVGEIDCANTAWRIVEAAVC